MNKQPEMNEFGEVITPIEKIITTLPQEAEAKEIEVKDAEVSETKAIGTTSGGDATKKEK